MEPQADRIARSSRELEIGGYMNKESKLKQGFILKVDGREYGPFLERYKCQYSNLQNKSGVEFLPIWLESGWIMPISTKRAKKDRSTPLFENIGFVPISKGQHGA